MSEEQDITPTPTAERVGTIESRIEDLLFGGDDTKDAAPIEDVASTPDQEEDATDSDAADEQLPDELKDDDQETEEQATLAAHLGLEDDQLIEGDDGQMYVSAKINGETQKVNFQELLKGYQTEKAVTQKAQALAEQRKQFEQQAAQATQVYNDKISRASEALQIIEKNLVNGFEGVDWDQLRRDDPAEWAAKRQEMAQQYQKINSTRGQIQQEQERLAQEQQAQHEQLNQAKLAEEAERLLAANPTWQDPDIKKQELSGLRDFLTSDYGFSNDDLQYVTDHRLVSLIQDAHRYRQMKKQAAPKVSKKIPKYVKPGAPKPSASDTAKKQAKQKRSQLKKTGSIGDAAAILLDRM